VHPDDSGVTLYSAVAKAVLSFMSRMRGKVPLPLLIKPLMPALLLSDHV
jgi:hypothetical protein